MSQRRVRWAAALLPLVAIGSAWAVDEAAPDRAAVVKARATIASLIEKSLVDCAPPTGLHGPELFKARLQQAGVDKFPVLQGRPEPEEPMKLMREGNQAILVVGFLTDALGNNRFVHVEREVASTGSDTPFDAFTIRSIRRMHYTPAMVAKEPVALWQRLKVTYIAGGNRMGSILSDEKLTEFVLKARDGDATAQVTVSYLDSIAHNEVGIAEQEGRHFLAASASNGERNALDQVTRLLGQPSCHLPAEVEAFLYQQAMRGKSNLELIHATRMIVRGHVEAHPEVLPMLRGAANSDSPFVQMWAAGILASSPIEALRDPPAALEAAQSLKLDDDPDAAEALAAALAANGRFAEAVTAEKVAIARAFRWHWNDSMLRKRLASYMAGQPWVGWLCDCDRLVPERGF
jgi:hypothetical protein